MQTAWTKRTRQSSRLCEKIMASKKEVSFQREELERHLLYNNLGTLEYVEEKFAGIVRLRIVRRTRAVVALRIKGYVRERLLFLHLPDEETIECALEVEGQWVETLRRDNPDLYSLALHRGCEAMLALRNGHKEYVRVSNRKRASKKLEQQIQKADV